jgi:hydroxymethylglutaryl-CoA lyase
MLPKQVRIREVGPREGFQTLEQVIPTDQKLRLIEALTRTGVSEIEVASFVKPDRVPQMADAAELVSSLPTPSPVSYRGLYLNQKGFERVVRCPQLSVQGWLHAASSETFLQCNSNRTLPQLLSEVPTWCELFTQHGVFLHGLMLSTAFGCNYEGVVSTDQSLKVLSEVREKIAECGAELQEVCLADTVGLGAPNSVRRLVVAVQDAFPELTISLHLHDTRGTGMANVYAGLLEGIEIFDASVAGIGGCPFAKGAAGNVCSEDVVYLCREMGVGIDVDLEAYAQAAHIAAEVLGSVQPGKYYKTVKKQ